MPFSFAKTATKLTGITCNKISLDLLRLTEEVPILLITFGVALVEMESMKSLEKITLVCL